MQCLLLYTRYLQVGVQLGPRFDNTVAAIIDVCRPLWEKVQLPEESLIPYDAVVMRYSAEVSPRIPTHVDDCEATLNICLQTAQQGGGLKFFLPEANWFLPHSDYATLSPRVCVCVGQCTSYHHSVSASVFQSVSHLSDSLAWPTGQ